ncbi:MULTISPECIES: hypothetical protein [Methylosinus]|uniref:Uncharacterized protein n=1 Tax=Methylosinus trichosporium (strain ATCC 35070 / NCIMB 11131 / UNIQEM 75 / OB3b) TaxID=595536 RepID=A0A2D2D6J9_METT3|nr:MULTISPECIES: hypothetical protein [Methylosinus]ATQ70637.1 hypothetical protein CQW49_21865 [Methylosinus trichosporium OB3b]OBS50742.1 hypothetical protein A8B73_19945 [Methylosinus sp. 3S-1]
MARPFADRKGVGLAPCASSDAAPRPFAPLSRLNAQLAQQQPMAEFTFTQRDPNTQSRPQNAISKSSFDARHHCEGRRRADSQDADAEGQVASASHRLFCELTPALSDACERLALVARRRRPPDEG